MNFEMRMRRILKKRKAKERALVTDKDKKPLRAKVVLKRTRLQSTQKMRTASNYSGNRKGGRGARNILGMRVKRHGG